jgi:hypothetical protein
VGTALHRTQLLHALVKAHCANWLALQRGGIPAAAPAVLIGSQPWAIEALTGQFCAFGPAKRFSFAMTVQ